MGLRLENQSFEKYWDSYAFVIIRTDEGQWLFCHMYLEVILIASGIGKAIMVVDYSNIIF